jgi:DNA-binding NarL/FixJ family response regulator
MIKILAVEDNEIVRTMLADMLNQQDDMEIIGTAEDGLAALQLIDDGLKPDVVLADLNMERMDGIELTQNLTTLHSSIKVIVLTMHANSAFLSNAQAAGARGYLLKDGDMDELYNAIRKVNNGEVYIGLEANS